ncbi:f-box domain containing protein [Grosmannia clavigera kw1407]|uniref:F-box domain containing protein n=1 Tax=Grosmannia clavigera (strain kw1407 / UAMH 11150) TaxID=655863 RepID=F0XJL3_GROCL|nr:f-box domain containing protein [Grosmannia clavigera kw1407]EFX02084.1 f-box domain containing protein [Grosmannia clavigera kw1407]
MASTADESSIDSGQGPEPATATDTSLQLIKGMPLPSEIVAMILKLLTPVDLAALSCVCRALHLHAMSDRLWRILVQKNVPGMEVTSPGPFGSFRELYIAHFPYWFIPQKKVWIGGDYIVGTILIARYEPEKARIEGYQLLSRPWISTPEPGNAGAFSNLYDPTNLELFVEQPKIMLDANDRPPRRGSLSNIPMAVQGWSDPAGNAGLLRRKLIFATPMTVEDELGFSGSPCMAPPFNIPAPHRVLCEQQLIDGLRRENTSMYNDSDDDEDDYGLEVSCRPFRRAHLSKQAFHIPQYHRFINNVDTYATIESVYYTPTADKPFQGIFIADYGGHGYELVLIHQPDDHVKSIDEDTVVDRQLDGETEAEYKERRNARIYRGSLEAIKLTGDINVPRGEITFVANDLSATDNSGTDIGIAEAVVPAGVRRICCKGQIADHGYKNHRFIDCRLFPITPDCLALYWIPFNHVMFYKRVDIDAFTRPAMAASTGADGFLLRVTAGTSYDRATHVEVPVNEPRPVRLQGASADISLCVRIHGYDRGLPRASPPTSAYFAAAPHAANGDTYSIGLAFTPRAGEAGENEKDAKDGKDGKTAGISGHDLLWGNDFDHSIRDHLPPGFNTALRIMRWWIDPGIDGDAYADKPYLYGPALSSFNRVHVGGPDDVHDPHDDRGFWFEEGGDAAGLAMRAAAGCPPDDPAARQKWALTDAAKSSWVWAHDQTYGLDFFNAYLDFRELALRLPGFHLPVMKYWDGQSLRYVLRNRTTEEVYLVVEITLLRQEDVDEDGTVSPEVLAKQHSKTAPKRDDGTSASSDETAFDEDKALDEARRKLSVGKGHENETESAVETSLDDVE